MSSKNEQPSVSFGRPLERAIVLVLLIEKHESRYSCAQLASLLEADLPAFEHALARLSETGLIARTGSELWASPAARHMDELGLIAI